MTNLPEKIQFNLETAEADHEATEITEPFKASLAPIVDRVVTITNPRDLTVEEFESLDQGNPLAFLTLCVADDDDKKAIKKLKAKHLDWLLESYLSYFKLDKGKSAGRLF